MRALALSASDSPVRLGARLRASRHAQGLTIEQVASATGLTKGFISRVERDETSPSVATLLTLCQALSIPVGSLFEAAEAELVRAATAPKINMGGTGADERLMTPRAQSRVQVIRSTMKPHASGGEELYTINCDVEVMQVVRGTVVIRFTDSETELSTGDALTFHGSEPHTWTNRTDADAEVIWTIVPAAWSGAS
jgi:transcriptional regulator with XRE-family HTH domain